MVIFTINTWSVGGIALGAILTVSLQFLSQNSVQDLAIPVVMAVLSGSSLVWRDKEGWNSFVLFASCTCLFLELGAQLSLFASHYYNASWTRCIETLLNGREILKVWLLRHGQNIYPGSQDYHFLATLYTPVYYVVCAALLMVVDNPVSSTTAVSFLSLLGLSIVIAIWIRKETGSFWLAVAVAGLFLIHPTIRYAGKYARPDFLAWMLVLLGAYLFLAPGQERVGRVQVLLGCLALCLGPLTKQQTLPILLACITVFMFRHPLWKRCLFLAGFGLAAAGVALVVLQVLTGGNFLTHAVLYPAALARDGAITDWGSLLSKFKSFASRETVLLGLYGIAILHGAWRRRLHEIDWLIVVQMPFLAQLVITWGADANYWWGMLVLLYLRVGVFLGSVIKIRYLGASVATVLLIFCPPCPSFLLWNQTPVASQTYQDDLVMAKAVAAAGPGDILINSEASPPVLPLDYSLRLHFFDALELKYFELTKFWRFSESIMNKDIAEKRFATIVVGRTFINPAIPNHIRNYYQTESALENYSIFKPRLGNTVVYSVPTDQVVTAPHLSVQLSIVDGVDVGSGFGGFFISKNQSAEFGKVTFVLQSEESMASVRVAMFAKVAHFGVGNSVLCEWSKDGTSYVPFLDYAGLPNDMNLSLFDTRVEAEFAPRVQRVFIRVTLNGSAQLWFNKDFPIAFMGYSGN